MSAAAGAPKTELRGDMLVEATPQSIERAAALLRAGGLVAFPTETVYGLGADATDGRAVARIFEAKGRPRFNPLIVHVASLAEAERLVRLTPQGRDLAAAFWPGPLTLIAERQDDCPVADLATAGLATIAVRVPAHPVALELIARAGRPLAAPSANRSGRVSPTTAQHVADDLGDRVDLILDGGPTLVGVESTIVEATRSPAVILRAGGVTREQLEQVCPVASEARVVTDGAAGHAPTAPGQLASHYAPRARVRLGAREARSGEALLAFGPAVPAHDGPMLNLSPTGDLREAAASLFSSLRRLDATGAECIAVMAIPRHGLGTAINDRLERAAAPRGAPGEDHNGS